MSFVYIARDDIDEGMESHLITFSHWVTLFLAWLSQKIPKTRYSMGNKG